MFIEWLPGFFCLLERVESKNRSEGEKWGILRELRVPWIPKCYWASIAPWSSSSPTFNKFFLAKGTVAFFPEGIIFQKFFYIIVKCYFPFTVITKYWPYFLCCTIHPSAYLIPKSLYLSVFHPYIAPFPSPMVMTSVFSMSVSLLFAIFTSLLYFLNPTYKWYHEVFVFLWLFSLSIMPSKSMFLKVANFHF